MNKYIYVTEIIINKCLFALLYTSSVYDRLQIAPSLEKRPFLQNDTSRESRLKFAISYPSWVNFFYAWTPIALYVLVIS